MPPGDENFLEGLKNKNSTFYLWADGYKLILTTCSLMELLLYIGHFTSYSRGTNKDLKLMGGGTGEGEKGGGWFSLTTDMWNWFPIMLPLISNVWPLQRGK